MDNEGKIDNIQIFGVKYEGMGSSALQPSQPNYQQRRSTLQEPVIQTIKRDLNKVLEKVVYVFKSNQSDSQLQKIQKDWDLWGPLIITLTIATMATISTQADHQQLFTNLFLLLWLGPLVISLNSILLGVTISIIQSVCLIIYCTSPIMASSIILAIINIFFRNFFLNICISGIAFFFTVRGSKQYFRLSAPKDKEYLILYPIILFYLFLGSYISMV